MAQVEKSKFRNTTNGFLGAITIDHRGERKGISIPPGDDVWLSDDEILETAEAPRDPVDSPFTDQIELVRDPDNPDAEPKEINHGPRLVLVTERRPVPSLSDRQLPDTGGEKGTTTTAVPVSPPKGSYAPGEEIGTPEAQPA